MFQIVFYHSVNGVSEIENYLDFLGKSAETNKSSRILRHKILSYMLALSIYGTRIGTPYVKHINGDLWELRPMNNRLFFFFLKDDTFVFLHYFVKKSNRTPVREIDKANANMKDYLERIKQNEHDD